MIVSTDISCTHCGERCDDDTILVKDHYFCCYGCKAVYELLSDSNMLHYYDNENLRTEKVTFDLGEERKYAFLDHIEVGERLIRYQDDNRSVVRFNLPGIHCSSCIYLLEHLPRLAPSVLQSQVNFIKKEVTLTFTHTELSLKQLAVLLSQLGYPPAIQLDSMNKQGDDTKGKSSIGLKIAVAGFCFGNSMLMSLPEYLDTGLQLDSRFSELFNWINLVLSIPIVFYSGADYFKSAFKGLKSKHLNIDVPISLGILTLFLRSIFEIVSFSGVGYVDSLAGLVFFLLIGKWYQGKTYEALSFERDYKSYFPISVTKVIDGEESNVLIEHLKKKDHVLLRNQELIPADGMITSGTAQIDYSFVTGESALMTKNVGEKVFAGGRQLGTPIEIELLKEVNNSELTQLWNSQVFGKNDENRYGHLIDKVSKYFTMAILLIAFLTGIYWYIVDAHVAWNAVSAVLIIACPCALALTLPFAYGHGTRLLGRYGLYLKDAGVIERLARIRHIIFDKTGTLTEAKSTSLNYRGEALNEVDWSILKTITANSVHPLSRLIYTSISDDINKLPITTFNEVPGQGIIANVIGHEVKLGSAAWVGAEVSRAMNKSYVYVQIDGNITGYFEVLANYREGVFNLLHTLRKFAKLHLLSGDIDSEGSRLNPHFDVLNFNQKPENKLNYISQISEPSLMMGDGLNDAGALKAASVGLGVAEDIYQFSPACDGVLAASSLNKMSNILLFIKSVMGIVKLAFIISFTYNMVGLFFAVSGQLTPIISAILMPISSLTVVGAITILVEYFGRKHLSE